MINGAYHGLRKILRRILDLADRLLNGIFSTDYNPLYRSGTIAVLLLMIATVTGLILVFFYRLGESWESVRAMQDQVWFGRWLRAVHRYSSDACVVAVALHILRMFAQGKSWGPRAFSWITGVMLLLLLFISAWSGFVLVWDTQAQVVAIAGGRIIDSLGLLADPISSSFSGITDSPPASFFFLNLFLHVVVPLGMIFGIWVHTSKMARATWFPQKPVLYGIISLLVALGILFPAPLGSKASLLSQPTGIPLDSYFNFWIPLSESKPSFVFWAWVSAFILLIILPWALRPRESRITAPAFNDPNICQGCTQCVQDCPYEAITLVPRMAGPPISTEVAQVISSLCVSCGLCSASCAPMTMGPPDRKGTHQYQAAKAFIGEFDKSKIAAQTLIIGCKNQADSIARFERMAGPEESRAVQIYPSDCPGTLHMAVLDFLAAHFGRVFIAACPERNCTNKDGHFLLRERLAGIREPFPSGRVPPGKVILHPVGAGEEKKLWNRIRAGSAKNWRREFLSVAAGFILFIGIAKGGSGIWEHGQEFGMLRLNWRLAGQTEKLCAPLSSDALKNLPAHMKAPESCQYTMLSYVLTVTVNGEQRFHGPVRPGGFRSDRPLYVAQDIPLPPGWHRVELSFTPEKEIPARTYALDSEVEISRGGIALVHMSPDQQRLLLKEVK